LRRRVQIRSYIPNTRIQILVRMGRSGIVGEGAVVGEEVVEGELVETEEQGWMLTIETGFCWLWV